MSKKTMTLREQYEAVLGKPVSEFEVVAFRFDDTTKMEHFNTLRLVHRLSGELYDCNHSLNTVTIVFRPEDTVARSQAVKLADELDAKQITPIL